MDDASDTHGPERPSDGHTGSSDPVEAARHQLPVTDGALDRACSLVAFLREHCPWDRKQTPRTLVPHLLEEAQETAEAIRREDRDALEGELGDLLLNLAFQVVIGEEEGNFTRDSVVRRLERKMIRRHPHLFDLGEEEDWEVLKRRERREDSESSRIHPEAPEESQGLAEVPGGLEPLLRAHRIQERESSVGFDWEDARGALAKVREELEEVEEALAEGVDEKAVRLQEEELGDLLFSVVNLVRLTGGHAERALGEANDKFQARFTGLEQLARARGVDLEAASLEELDALWEEVKAGTEGRGGA